MSKVEIGYNINLKTDFHRLNMEALSDTFEVTRKTFALAEEDKMITQELLKELYSYNEDTGLFTRIKAGKGFPFKLGTIAGGTSNGYVNIKVKNKKYSAHRLVWLYMYGHFPDGVIDHINHDGTDNRLCNLRVVTHKDNVKNQRLNKSNKSGHCGVTWKKSHSKWVANIKDNGKQIRLGLFTNKADAITARKEAEIKYEYHPNHGKDRL